MSFLPVRLVVALPLGVFDAVTIAGSRLRGRLFRRVDLGGVTWR